MKYLIYAMQNSLCGTPQAHGSDLAPVKYPKGVTDSCRISISHALIILADKCQAQGLLEDCREQAGCRTLMICIDNSFPLQNYARFLMKYYYIFLYLGHLKGVMAIPRKSQTYLRNRLTIRWETLKLDLFFNLNPCADWFSVEALT
jgi:hypothetical protein